MSNSVANELARGSEHVQHVMVDTANLRVKVGPNGGARSDICLHNVPDDFDCLSILKDRRILIRLSYDSIPCGIGQRHEILNQSVLKTFLALRRNHMTTCFIKRMYLLWRKITRYLPHVADNFVNERFVFSGLEGNKMPPALVRDLDECVASHILDTCFEELESR